MRKGFTAALAAGALVLACRPAPLTDADRAAIEQEITQLFADQAEMIESTDTERWLTQFEASEDFVLAALGDLYTHATVDSSIRNEWPTITESNFAWGDLRVRILARDLATVSTTFEWSGTVGDGEMVDEAGTWTAVMGKRDGAWKYLVISQSKPDPKEDEGDAND
jgi:hypothetical protein